MGVDVSRLSPKAQKQVYEKLLESNRRAAGTTFGAGEGNLTSQKKSAQRGSKYGNKKVEVNGIQFDSKKEARRYLDLRAMEIAGQIQNLRRQVPYLLIHSQKVDGKVVEKPVTYVADFVYEQNGETVVEDVKGYRKGAAYSLFVIKRKLMLSVWGIQIREV